MDIDNLTKESKDFTGNVWLLDGEEKVLIDAGTGDCWKNIRELENIDKVIITHSHRDHVENLSKVLKNFEPEIYAFEPENLSVKASKLEDEEFIQLSNMEFQVIHTPGHRDDSICLYNRSEGILFTGDLIFPEGGFGRTDLEQGDREKLINSITRIEKLEVESFYPGHDEAVTEKAGQWINKSLKNAEKRKPKY